MSKEQMDALQAEFKTKRTIPSNLPKELQPKDMPAAEKTWIDTYATVPDKEVVKMTPKQQEKYIHTGEK
jgi:hypothetical protein